MDDLEAIKRLKARYFRLMDTKKWDEFAEVFAADAVIGGGDQQTVGRSAIVDFIRTTAGDAKTAHQGFLPEIDITEPDRATGIWAMSDYFELRGTTPPIGFTGYGHYADSYARIDGTWQITASRLSRLKIIPLAGGLPDFYQR